MEKKIIILGSYGHTNLGDDAIITSVLTAFKDIIPDAQITVFCKNFKGIEEKFGVKTINPWRWLDLLKVIKAHSKADLFILGGGGLLQDKTSIFNLLFWCVHVILAKIFNKPVMCYAVGAGPIDSKFGKILTRFVINKVDLLTVRDETSRSTLKELNIDRPPIHVTADPAVLLPPENMDRAVEILTDEGVEKKDKPLIAISLFYWFHTKSFLPVKFVIGKGLWTKKEKQKFMEFKRSMAQLGDYLVEKLNAHLVFISMKKSDYDAALEVTDTMKRQKDVSVLSEKYNSAETKSILGQMDLTIGMHLHSLILSASMGTPVFGLVYDPKITGFMRLIGQEDNTYRIENIELSELIKKIEDVWARRNDIQQHLRLRIKELSKQSLLNAEFVRQLLQA